MKISTKLKKISENPNKDKLVKRYLLDCCEKLQRFRSNSSFPKQILLARKYLKGFATQKQIHRVEWELEGEAFGVEHYSEKGIRFYFRANVDVKENLVKVRISKSLTNKETRKYLGNIAYFIDHVFCYMEYSSNWLFTEQCEQFMCSKLYSRYFGSDA